jgi:hypothetical protein
LKNSYKKQKIPHLAGASSIRVGGKRAGSYFGPARPMTATYHAFHILSFHICIFETFFFFNNPPSHMALVKS